MASMAMNGLLNHVAPGAPSGGGGGIGGLLKKTPVGMIAGGLGGVFSALGANKQAKTEAQNSNKMNAWKSKLDKANWDVEQRPYREQGSKMRGWRDTLMRGVMRNPNNGLSKLFGGWDEGKGTAFNAAQDVRSVANPMDAAGPVPEMKAATGGWASVIGGGLKGIMGGA